MTKQSKLNRSPGRSKQKGVVAIETALGLFSFLLMIFFWLEVSYMGFVSALMDYSVTEAARVAKASADNRDYSALFKNNIRQSGSLWGQFVDTGKISIRISYYPTVDDTTVESGECKTDTPEESRGTLTVCGETVDHPIAVYQVSYPYEPLLLSMFIETDSLSIRREVITIQEYERTEFND